MYHYCSTVLPLLTDLYIFIIHLIEAEKSLHDQLLAIGSNQLKGEGKIQDISKIVKSVVRQEQHYQREVADIQKLLAIIRQHLEKAKRDIQSIVSGL